jgi:hypothetical protein
MGLGINTHSTGPGYSPGPDKLVNLIKGQNPPHVSQSSRSEDAKLSTHFPAFFVLNTPSSGFMEA